MNAFHPLPDDAGDWLIIGCVTKPHGVHGAVLAEIITDFPERLTSGMKVGLGPESGPETVIETHDVRYHRGRWLIEVVGIRNRDEVEDWRRLYLFLPEQQLDELPEGYYYEHHLVGLECVNRDGDALGTITAMEDSGGQTRVVVRRERREFLVPWVPAIVVEVRLDDGRVVLDPPRGLLDDDAVMA